MSASLMVPAVPRLLPGPAGKLQQLAAAGALEQATPELLGLKDGAALTPASSEASRLQDGALQSPAWAAARAFAAQQEARSDGALQLKSIQDARVLSVGKLPLMLVVLGSLQPSGGGSAFAKAKDPSGSIGAALHASVLAQQPALAAGAVLLLQQVSVFTPAPGSSFLAVTDKNVQQVWQAEAGWPGFQPRVQRHLQQRAHTQQPPSMRADSSGSQQPRADGPPRQTQGARLSQQQQPWRVPRAVAPQASGTGQASSVLPPANPDIQTMLQLPPVGGAARASSQWQLRWQQAPPPLPQQQQWPAQLACLPSAALTSPASASSSAPGTTGPSPRSVIVAHDRACMPPPPPRMQPSSFRLPTQQQQWRDAAAPPAAAAADDFEVLLAELADIDAAGHAASDAAAAAAAAAPAAAVPAPAAAAGAGSSAATQPVSRRPGGGGRQSGGASTPHGSLQQAEQENECGDDVVRAIFGSQLCGLQQGGGTCESGQAIASCGTRGWQPSSAIAGCIALPPPTHKRARVEMQAASQQKAACCAPGGGQHLSATASRPLSLLDDLEVDESEFGLLL